MPQASRKSNDAAGRPSPDAPEGLSDTLRDVVDEAKSLAGEGLAKAKEQAGRYAGQARDSLADFAARRKDQAADQIGNIARVMERLGEEVADEVGGPDWARQAVEDAAGTIESLSTTLRERDLGDLIDEVTGFARRHPALVIGGAALAGILVGRLLSQPAAAGGDDSTDDEHVDEAGGEQEAGPARPKAPRRRKAPSARDIEHTGQGLP